MSVVASGHVEASQSAGSDYVMADAYPKDSFAAEVAYINPGWTWRRL
jgi:hypothetical protein